LRPFAKIENGETRLFTMPPVDYTICARMLMQHWMAAFYNAHSQPGFYSAIGCDPASYDWTKIFTDHSSKSDKAVDGDFGDFDGTLEAQCTASSYDDVFVWIMHQLGLPHTACIGDDGASKFEMSLKNYMHHVGRRSEPLPTFRLELYDLETGEPKWYSYSIGQFRNALRRCGAEIYDTLLLISNVIVQKSGGNNSGGNATAPCNSKVNLYYCYLAFLDFCRRHNMSHLRHKFFELIALTTYGDDNLFTPIPELAKLGFDFYYVSAFLAKHRIRYTSASKSDSPPPLTDLHKCTFLKQGFRVDEQYPQLVRPTIDFATINQLTNWISKGLPSDELTIINCENALRFASHYDKNTFDDLLCRMNAALAASALPVFPDLYEDLNTEFYEKCGIYTAPP
jgi:hypothetical protein